MPAHFGAKLRRLREGHNLTQADLGHRLALFSQSHIAKVESGRDQPSLDLVVRVAHLFKVTIDSLLRDSVPVAAIQSLELCLTSEPGVDAVQLGQQVRRLRQEFGLTQVALAQRLGQAVQSGIAKIERGDKLPSLERLVQLADVFGVSADALLFASEPGRRAEQN
jgi:transcriptional regulator with XRE-family HTH domain